MKTVISVKVDKDIKEKAQEVAASAGISLSTMINSYLRQVTATRRIELYAPEQMTPKLESLIADVEAEIAEGRVSEGFTSVDDFLADLKK
jgi:addiction module RelB/DinJ family antitoxin